MTTVDAIPTPDLEFDIAGMTCGACVRHVEEAIDEVEGARASVDLATERAIVSGLTQREVSRVIDAVHEAGYQARQRRGPDEVSDDRR